MRPTTNLSLRSTLTAFAFLSIAAHGAAQDRQAAYAPMFNATTTSPSSAPVRLAGGAPPLIGQSLSTVVQAPGYGLSVLMLGTGANAGITLPYASGTLDLYISPLSLLGVLPLSLQSGQGTFSLPLPPMPALVGLDLGMQAIALTPNGQGGASNLLVANLGDSLTGGAVFAFAFTKPLLANSYLLDGANQKMSIYCNSTTANVQVTLSGTKQSNKGPVEVRDGTGKVLATIPYASDTFSITFTVPANTCIYLFNTGTTGLTMSWDVAVK